MSTRETRALKWRFGTVSGGNGSATVIEVGERLIDLASLLAKVGDGSPPVACSTRDLLEDWHRWEPVLNNVAAQVSDGSATDCELDTATVEWLPPIVYPRKIVICGANYRDHVEEMGADPDGLANPFTLLKPPTTSPIGHRQPIVIPEQVTWIDWEGELGVVIGRRARHVSRNDALSVIAGYCPVNDVSARDWAERQAPGVGMDWTLHKGFDGFTPAGPLITPARFVPDPQDLRIELTVNGVTKQDASTGQMIFGVARLIEHLTSVMTLEPGDMLLTGSPSGVGFGRSPRERMMPGDDVTVSITGLGQLTNSVIAETR